MFQSYQLPVSNGVKLHAVSSGEVLLFLTGEQLLH